MEPYAGRWSRLVAREFVPWLDTTPQLVWLDLGCGTGALTHATLTAGSPGMLVAFDRSINDLVAARHHARSSAARIVATDARDLPVPGVGLMSP